MKLQKKGQLQTVRVTPGIDKHKLWLIIGIVLVAILVLAIVFLSPARQTLFGKGIDFGSRQDINRVIDIGDIPVTTDTTSDSATSCMDIQLLPASVRNINLKIKSTQLRQSVCESAGCNFHGAENPPVIENDGCQGIRTGCPRVDLYLFRGSTYESGRRNLCESVGCVFTSGGDTTADGDLCTASVLVEICDNNLDDDIDGMVDCADTDCAGQAADARYNICEAQESTCLDGFDNDRDGSVDGFDLDCAGRTCTLGGGVGTGTGTGTASQYHPTSEYGIACCLAVDDCATRDSVCVSFNQLSPDGHDVCLYEHRWNTCTTALDGAIRGTETRYRCDGATQQWMIFREDQCNDGIDDDGDSAVDCADSDCSGNSICTSTESNMLGNVYADYNYDVDPAVLLEPQLLDSNDLLMLSLLIESNANTLGNSGSAAYQGDFYGYPVWLCDDGQYSFTDGEITTC